MTTAGDNMASWLVDSGLAMVAAKVLGIMLVVVLLAYTYRLARAGLSVLS